MNVTLLDLEVFLITKHIRSQQIKISQKHAPKNMLYMSFDAEFCAESEYICISNRLINVLEFSNRNILEPIYIFRRSQKF